MSFYLVASEASLIRSHLGWTEDGGCKSREFLRKEFSSRRNSKSWMFGVWERARSPVWQILSFYKRRNWSLILADTNVPIKLILAAVTKWPNISTQEKCVFVYRKTNKQTKKSRGLLQAVIQRPRLLPYCVFTIFNARLTSDINLWCLLGRDYRGSHIGGW